MEKIKSQLTTAYMMFTFEFADPSTINKDHLLKSLPFKLFELFDTQRAADKAKRLYGKENFKKLLSLYFDQYQSGKGLDVEALNSSLLKNKKALQRHIGKDKITYLLLIVTLMNGLDTPQPRKGLLFERASA